VSAEVPTPGKANLGATLAAYPSLATFKVPNKTKHEVTKKHEGHEENEDE
jgi:hypothetical protein